MKVFVERTTEKIIRVIPQSDGSVKVLANNTVSQMEISQVLRENACWLMDAISSVCSKKISHKIPNDLSRDEATNPCTTEQIQSMFACKSVLICGEICNVQPTSSATARFKDSCICIGEKQFGDKALRQRAVAGCIKKLASQVLPSKISNVGEQVGKCPTKIQIKMLDEKWCDCKCAENCGIVLDCRVAQLPEKLQRLVIAHAFCHFDVGGHGEDFCKQLANYCVDYKVLQRQLSCYTFLFDVF